MSQWDKPNLMERFREIAQKLSAADIAVKLNKEFGTDFTRNAIIGKMRRLHFKPTREKLKAVMSKPKKPKRPKVEHGGIWRRIDSLLADANKAATDLPTDHSPLATTLAGLLNDRTQCRYPVTTPDGEAQLFCAADVVNGYSYCARHFKVCYRPPKREVYVSDNLRAA